MKKALLNLHLAVFLAGFTGVLGRWISLNETLLVWYRLLITVFSLFLLTMIQGGLPRVSFKNLVKIFAVGAIVALHWVMFYGSIKHSNVSIALVCLSAIGFFSALLEPLLLRKRFEIAEVLLGIAAICGVYLIFHFDTRYKTGIIYGIASALLSALFTVLNKSMLKTCAAKTVTFYELAGGFIFLTILLPFYLHSFHLQFMLPLAGDWVCLLVLSWLCTILAFYLSLSALEKVSSFTVNVSYNLEPVYGIILAFLIYQENKTLSIYFYLGLLLIISAVTLQMMRIYYTHKKLQPAPLIN